MSDTIGPTQEASIVEALMNPLQAQVRFLRIFGVTLFLAVLLYAAIGEKVGGTAAGDVRLLKQVLIVAAVATLGTAVMIRQRRVRPAEETVRLQPENLEALGRWRAGYIASLVLCEAVGLYGLVLRMLGGSFLEAAPFYGVALLLLVVWTPLADFVPQVPGSGQ